MKIESKYLKAPISAQLEITDLCNHRCIHCYHLEPEFENRAEDIINDNTVIECAQKLIANNIFEVTITGGEPFVKRGLLAKLIQIFKKNGVDISINTNLTLLTDDILDLICINNIGLLVSCPSGIQTTFEQLVGINSFKCFERNLRKLIDKGVHFTINMVVHKMNIKEIRRTAIYLRELGCKSFAATPICPNIAFPHNDLLLSKEEVLHIIDELLWIEKNLDLYVDLLEVIPKCLIKDKVSTEHVFFNRKCQAGRTSIAVSPSGSVRPCAHDTESYGNILHEDMLTIWNRMSDWRSSAYIPKECQTCKWIYHCNGGCRASAKAISGEWNGMDRLATAPISIPFPLHESNNEYDFDTVFEVNDFKYREEDSNTYVIYVIKFRQSMMVNHEFFYFIQELYKKNLFNQTELSELFRLSEEQCSEMIAILLANNLIHIKSNFYENSKL
ncbi:MAG: radical SAM protein [Candidatus Cryptobacteroides sp.]